LIEPIFELANVRLPAVLKNHAELHFGLLCGFDEGVGTRGADFDRLFRKDVEAVTGGRDALRGVEAGRTADDDKLHGAMLQEGFKVLIGSAAVFAAETGDFFGVGSVDGGDLDAGDGASGAGVGIGDVAAADEANVGGHEKFSVVGFWFR
jgi:hypothetical protein